MYVLVVLYRLSVGNSLISYPDYFRSGKIPHEASVPDTELRVLEVDISSLNLSQVRPARVCPEGGPSVDAIILCYDAGREASFLHVEDVLRA